MRLPDWLRWILVLPVATIAYFAIQIAIGLGSETLPYPSTVRDWISQLINSCLGPWAFVYAGAQLAPAGRALHAAIALAVVYGVFVGAIGLFLLASYREGSVGISGWWVGVTTLISLAMVVATCIQIARKRPV